MERRLQTLLEKLNQVFASVFTLWSAPVK